MRLRLLANANSAFPYHPHLDTIDRPFHNHAMRYLLILCIFLFTSLTGATASPIDSTIKKVVALVYGDSPSGTPIPLGTAFFVAMTNQNYQFAYVVTAKHVIIAPDAHGYRNRIYLRLNTRNGNAEYVPLDIISAGTNKNLFVDDDQTVDIAVIAGAPDPNKFDFIALPTSTLRTKDEFQSLNIHEGSDVFFPGLFQHFQGIDHIYPMVRFGRVTLMATEKIPWIANVLTNGIFQRVDTNQDLYLIEAMAAGGNSGSPVFLYIAPKEHPDTIVFGERPTLIVAGVLSGHYNEGAELYVQTTSQPLAAVNEAVAAVVPAYKIRALLFSKELDAVRAALATAHQHVTP